MRLEKAVSSWPHAVCGSRVVIRFVAVRSPAGPGVLRIVMLGALLSCPLPAPRISHWDCRRCRRVLIEFVESCRIYSIAGPASSCCLPCSHPQSPSSLLLPFLLLRPFLTPDHLDHYPPDTFTYASAHYGRLQAHAGTNQCRSPLALVSSAQEQRPVHRHLCAQLGQPLAWPLDVWFT